MERLLATQSRQSCRFADREPANALDSEARGTHGGTIQGQERRGGGGTQRRRSISLHTLAGALVLASLILLPRFALGDDTVTVNVQEPGGGAANDKGSVKPIDDGSTSGADGKSVKIDNTGKAVVTVQTRPGQDSILLGAFRYLEETNDPKTITSVGGTVHYYKYILVQDGKGVATKGADGNFTATIQLGQPVKVKKEVCQNDPSLISMTTSSFHNNTLSFGLIGTTFDASNQPASRPLLNFAEYPDESVISANEDHPGETAIGTYFDLAPIHVLTIDPINGEATFSDGALTIRDATDPNIILAQATITGIKAYKASPFDQLLGTLNWTNFNTTSPVLTDLFSEGPASFAFDPGIVAATDFFSQDGQSDGITTCMTCVPEPSSLVSGAFGVLLVFAYVRRSDGRRSRKRLA